MFLNKLQDYVYLETTFKKVELKQIKNCSVKLWMLICHSFRSAHSVSISYQSVNKISPTSSLINSRCHVNKALF